MLADVFEAFTDGGAAAQARVLKRLQDVVPASAMRVVQHSARRTSAMQLCARLAAYVKPVNVWRFHSRTTWQATGGGGAHSAVVLSMFDVGMRIGAFLGHPVLGVLRSVARLTKATAAAYSTARVLAATGVSHAGAFLERDAHGVAPWVTLALRRNVWVDPCDGAGLGNWALVQSCSRPKRYLFKCDAGRGVVTAVLSSTRASVDADIAVPWPYTVTTRESTTQPGVQRTILNGSPGAFVVLQWAVAP